MFPHQWTFGWFVCCLYLHLFLVVLSIDLYYAQWLPFLPWAKIIIINYKYYICIIILISKHIIYLPENVNILWNYSTMEYWLKIFFHNILYTNIPRYSQIIKCTIIINYLLKQSDILFICIIKLINANGRYYYNYEQLLPILQLLIIFTAGNCIYYKCFNYCFENDSIQIYNIKMDILFFLMPRFLIFQKLFID